MKRDQEKEEEADRPIEKDTFGPIIIFFSVFLKMRRMSGPG